MSWPATDPERRCQPVQESIKSLRRAAGMTQPQLAEKIGVHVNTIVNWEDGTTEPRASHIVAMAEAFGVSAERVMGLSEARPEIGVRGASDGGAA